MNLDALKNINKAAVALKASKAAFVIRKHSPEILTTVGVVGVVTSAVLASKATLHLEPIVDRASARLEEAEKKTHTLTADEYSTTDNKRELMSIYIKSAGEVTKLYGPAVIVGVVSIGCIIGGHGVMHKRNIASIAAYKGLEDTFNKYRKRVVEEFGEEKDNDLHYGLKDTVVKDENGKNQTIKTVDVDNVATDIKFFDKDNRNWTNSPDYNLTFVRAQEKMADQRLRSRGYLFLNEVLEDLGLEHTQAGAVTGWVMNGGGDDFVDFGIQDLQSAASRIMGAEEDSDVILLNFNVDGFILDTLPRA